MFILVSHDDYYGIRLIGVWNTWQEAKDTMDAYYEQALQESGLTDDDQMYACFTNAEEASVCPPHDNTWVRFRIFDGFNDAEINKPDELHFF